MDIQRLRNLTTGRLHTKMDHVYQDIEFFIGESVMTHMIPRVMQAIEPYLRAQVTDPRFWDGEHDAAHVGEYAVRPLTEEENDAALKSYAAMPDPLVGKEVIAITVGDRADGN